MKYLPLLVMFTQLSLYAQTIHLAGNNFGIAFEDATLTATNKTIIANDVLRLLAPSTNSAVYAAYSTPSPEGYIGVLNKMRGPSYFPKPNKPRDIKLNATNGLDIVVTKELSDEYLVSIAFLKNHQKALMDADAFAMFIITNKLTNLPLIQFDNMLLGKEAAPGTSSTPEDAIFAQELSEFNYYMPSILGFQFMAEGPGNQEYLWGVLPVVGKSSEIPIIYYQNQWRISWWFMQTGEQQW